METQNKNTRILDDLVKLFNDMYGHLINPNYIYVSTNKQIFTNINKEILPDNFPDFLLYIKTNLHVVNDTETLNLVKEIEFYSNYKPLYSNFFNNQYIKIKDNIISNYKVIDYNIAEIDEPLVTVLMLRYHLKYLKISMKNIFNMGGVKYIEDLLDIINDKLLKFSTDYWIEGFEDYLIEKSVIKTDLSFIDMLSIIKDITSMKLQSNNIYYYRYGLTDTKTMLIKFDIISNNYNILKGNFIDLINDLKNKSDNIKLSKTYLKTNIIDITMKVNIFGNLPTTTHKLFGIDEDFSAYKYLFNTLKNYGK